MQVFKFLDKQKSVFLCFVVCAMPFCLCFCSIQMFENEQNVSIQIQLPQPLEAHKLLSGNIEQTWTIRWYSKNGKINEKTGISECITIDLEKDSFTPIIAYAEIPPESSFYGKLSPAGAMYPHQAESTLTKIQVRLSWINGQTASIAEKALSNAQGDFNDAYIITSHANWNKIEQKITSFENPQNLNIEKAVKSLLAGSLNASALVVEKRNLIAIQKSLFLSQETCIPFYTTLFFTHSFLPPVTLEIYETQDKEQTINFLLQEGLTYLVSNQGFYTLSVKNAQLDDIFFTPY